MNWLNYHHLYYFYQIAKETSIANASKKLKTTQSSLSSQLKTLEESLGIKLFDRVGRKLVLTDKGQMVYKKAQKIFDMGDSLIHEVENNQLGATDRHFRVGAVSTLSKNIQQMFFSPLLKSNSVIDMHSSDLSGLLNRLENFDLDIIMTNYLPNELDEKYRAVHIHSFSYCLVYTDKVSIKEVKEMIIKKGIALPKSDPYTNALLNKFIEQFGDISKIVKAQIEDTALLRLLAVEDEQFALIPKIGVYKDLLGGRLKIVQTLEEAKESFYLIARPESFDLMDIDILVTEFKNKLIKGDVDEI